MRGNRPTAAAPQPQAPAQRARLTGRAAVLVLVVAVLMVSYASSMKAYLQQRSQLNHLRSEIATSQVKIAQLSRQKARWRDPAYVRAMAHQQFGWVLPGEISYQVIGLNGKPLDPHDTLSEPATKVALQPQWWQTAWKSVESAGVPAKARATPKPAKRINPPKP